MKMLADPLLVAVALGMLSPTVFEVDDRAGEASPPPMITTDLAQPGQSATRPRTVVSKRTGGEAQVG